jgi:hypothetical protein
MWPLINRKLDVVSQALEQQNAPDHPFMQPQVLIQWDLCLEVNSMNCEDDKFGHQFGFYPFFYKKKVCASSKRGIAPAFFLRRKEKKHSAWGTSLSNRRPPSTPMTNCSNGAC